MEREGCDILIVRQCVKADLYDDCRVSSMEQQKILPRS